MESLLCLYLTWVYCQHKIPLSHIHTCFVAISVKMENKQKKEKEYNTLSRRDR